MTSGSESMEELVERAKAQQEHWPLLAIGVLAQLEAAVWIMRMYDEADLLWKSHADLAQRGPDLSKRERVILTQLAERAERIRERADDLRRAFLGPRKDER